MGHLVNPAWDSLIPAIVRLFRRLLVQNLPRNTRTRCGGTSLRADLIAR